MVIIFENVRVTIGKGKDLFINIFYIVEGPILGKGIREGFFCKRAKERGWTLNRKGRREGAKGKITPFLLPLDRNRGGEDRGAGGPIPDGPGGGGG